jgi:hypothetical protein
LADEACRVGSCACESAPVGAVGARDADGPTSKLGASRCAVPGPDEDAGGAPDRAPDSPADMDARSTPDCTLESPALAFEANTAGGIVYGGSCVGNKTAGETLAAGGHIKQR